MVNSKTGIELWFAGTDVRGYSLAFAPDGKTLAIGTGNRAGYILLLDTATGHERQRLIGHRNAVSALIYSADGQRLFSASHDQRIGLWDLHDPAHVPSPRLLRGHRSKCGHWPYTTAELSPAPVRMARCCLGLCVDRGPFGHPKKCP
jgi:WD40 repeat protein